MTHCALIGKHVIQTLRWLDGHLEMIDQRVLPARFEYLPFASAAEVAEGIRAMVVRGAPAIGCAAAYGVALEALARRHLGPGEFAAAMERGFEVLAASRPTAVNLFWALQQMRRVWQANQHLGVIQIVDCLLAQAHEMAAEDVRINRAMGTRSEERRVGKECRS